MQTVTVSALGIYSTPYRVQLKYLSAVEVSFNLSLHPSALLNAILFSGLHCVQTVDELERHLFSILHPAHKYLEQLGATADNTALYLLATTGMRGLALNDQNLYYNVLGHARAVIQGFPDRRFAYQPTNIRTLTGQQEGWFAWIFHNYGLQRGGNPKGSLEMGGASLQYTYTVPDDTPNVNGHIAPICTDIIDPTFHPNVYSRTWEGLGADLLNNALVKSLNHTSNCPNQVCKNPCLPRNMPITRNGVQTVGTGNFVACKAFAASKAFSAARNTEELPFLAPLSDVPSLEAIASYYNTYRSPLFDSPLGVYNATEFGTRVENFCGADWNHAPPDPYTGLMCLNAAWILVSFEKARMQISFTRGNWNDGAAALIVNHGGLKLCPEEDELQQFDPDSPRLYGKFNESFDHIPQNLPLPAVPVAATPLVTLWGYLPFVMGLLFISGLLVQRYRAKAHGKVHLVDLEGERTGGCVRSCWDRPGFYKDCWDPRAVSDGKITGGTCA